MKVSGGIKIDIAAADGFTVSLSKYAHSYGVTADGTLKENLDTGLIKVSVKNGKTQLICPSTTTTQPSINGTYKVTSIVMGSGMTISKSISGNQFVFWPASYTVAGQVTMTLTIVAMWEGEDYTFTQEVTFSKTSDGREGTNYIPMGWWEPSITYSKTELGIPLVKKEDGTALGYSVYTLKVVASTPGSFILSEWDLVETADFIYMQQAYIERLQAEIVTADKIEALQITSKIVRTAAYGSRTEIEGNTIKIFNDISIFPNIVFGMKNGYSVMEYYDNAGVLLYDLGPEGISMVDVVEEAWIEVSDLLFLGADYTTVLTTSTIQSKYKRPLLQSQVTYYRYQSQRIGNVVSDPANDGRLFVSPSKTANKIPIGIYCRRQNGFQYNLFGQPYSTPTRQHPSNESYLTSPSYQIYFQPLYRSQSASPGLIDSSVYDAYWSEKIGLPPPEEYD